jgi:tetratricopeptide (TPR) repeat protein
MRQELGLLVKLATPLMSTKGYAATEVEQVFERAYVMSRQLPEGDHLFPLLRGLVSFYQVRADHPTACSIGTEMLAHCERRPDPVALVQAHYGHGVTLYDLVELDAAKLHLTEALSAYDPATHAIHVSIYGGYDPGVACRCWLAWIYWLRGEADRALRTSGEAIELARKLGHPFSLNWALLSAAIVHLHRGEAGLAIESVETADAIAREEEFPYQLAIGSVLRGWASLARGQPDEALARLDEALAGYLTTGAAVSRPGFMTLVALAKAMTGRPDEGLSDLERGFVEAEQTHQRLHLIELNRVRGELLRWSGGDHTEVEACFHRAIELARQFGVPTLELRAATSLAGLWHGQGRTAEAYDVLDPVYRVFQEGFDTRDLRAAKTLLEQLGK